MNAVLLQNLETVEGTIAICYILYVNFIVYNYKVLSILLSPSNVIQSVAVCPVDPFPPLDPNMPDTHGILVATKIYSQFVSSPIYYIILFHFPCLGACFRVLSANKCKAQKKLTELKHELGLKGKQTPLGGENPDQWKQFKDAEVRNWLLLVEKKYVVRVLQISTAFLWFIVLYTVEKCDDRE